MTTRALRPLLLRLGILAGIVAAVAACGTETVVVTQVVEKQVPQTVVVEKEKIVEKPVVQTVVVEKIVEGTTAPKVQQEGSLVVALAAVQSPITDPQGIVFPTATFMVGSGIHEGLFRWGIDATGKGSSRVPNLARDWEVSQDQSKVTLRLRAGIVFRAWNKADGKIQDWGEMTAEDVAWLYNRAGADNLDSRHDQASEIAETFKRFEAVDKYTVEAPFNVYRGDFIESTLSEAVGIQSKAAFEARQAGSGPSMPDTTGPLVVRNWLPNERIELVSVPDHWRKSPSFADMKMIEAPEASVRAAMLQAGEVDIAPVSVADVSRLKGAGITFNDAMRQFQGLWIHFAGNNWMTKDPVTGEPVERKTAENAKKFPWIGDPYENGSDFDPNTPSMVSARKVRNALAVAIDRDLISETILGGFGGPNYLIENEAHPEWKEKWKIPFNLDLARQLLAEAGHPNGFDMPLWCPAGVGNDPEVCQAVASQWEAIGVTAHVDVTTYTANRPHLVARTFTTPWFLPWGSNRNSASAATPGGTYPGCCRWPSIGFGIGYEDPRMYDFYEKTRAQEKGSPENLSTREEAMDQHAATFLEVGVADWPSLIGVRRTVASWELRPLQTINSFETIVLRK